MSLLWGPRVEHDYGGARPEERGAAARLAPRRVGVFCLCERAHARHVLARAAVGR